MVEELLNMNGAMMPLTVIPIVGDGACLFRSISCVFYDTLVIALDEREENESHTKYLGRF